VLKPYHTVSEPSFFVSYHAASVNLHATVAIMFPIHLCCLMLGAVQCWSKAGLRRAKSLLPCGHCTVMAHWMIMAHCTVQIVQIVAHCTDCEHCTIVAHCAVQMVAHFIVAH
jgi:hypothetical protein